MTTLITIHASVPEKEVQNPLTNAEVAEYKKIIAIENLTNSKTEHKTHFTGYNLYTSVAIGVLKSKPENRPILLKITGQLWRSLTTEEKQKWKVEAKKIVEVIGQSVTSTHHMIRGYNLYIKENYHNDQLVGGITDSTEIMKKLGSSWKQLDQKEKDQYNSRAKKINEEK